MPPYPPLRHRVLRGVLAYAIVMVIVVLLLQFFTPFPVLRWIT
jgi:hypothetical protein